MKTQLRFQAISRGDIQPGNVHQHPTAAQGGMSELSLALPPTQHLYRSLTTPLHVPMLPSVAQSSEENTAELSFTRFGFVGVQMGKSHPGTQLFQPRERCLVSLSTGLHFQLSAKGTRAWDSSSHLAYLLEIK